jgi:hypothetical protein
MFPIPPDYKSRCFRTPGSYKSRDRATLAKPDSVYPKSDIYIETYNRVFGGLVCLGYSIRGVIEWRPHSQAVHENDLKTPRDLGLVTLRRFVGFFGMFTLLCNLGSKHRSGYNHDDGDHKSLLGHLYIDVYVVLVVLFPTLSVTSSYGEVKNIHARCRSQSSDR